LLWFEQRSAYVAYRDEAVGSIAASYSHAPLTKALRLQSCRAEPLHGAHCTLPHVLFCTQVSSTHVAMLVCGIFNAAIFAKELEQGGYCYNESGCQWEKHTPSQHPDVLAQGSSLDFIVRQSHQASGLLSIEGGLEPADDAERTVAPSALAAAAAAADNNDEQPPRSKKAKKHRRTTIA
jgi:hypothetical protein